MTAPSEPQRAAVIAIGGNALIGEGEQGTIDEQFANARSAAREVATLVEAGWRIVVTHGNGPQVGFILLRSEMLNGIPFIPKLSLDMCVADSEGGVGYIVCNSLVNELARRGLPDRAVCVLTRRWSTSTTRRSADRPSRSDRPFPPPRQRTGANTRAGAWSKRPGVGFVAWCPRQNQSGSLKRVAVKTLLDAGFVVVAAGGGGIPVVEVEPGTYRGVEAVVDKDLGVRAPWPPAWRCRYWSSPPESHASRSTIGRPTSASWVG